MDVKVYIFTHNDRKNSRMLKHRGKKLSNTRSTTEETLNEHKVNNKIKRSLMRKMFFDFISEYYVSGNPRTKKFENLMDDYLYDDLHKESLSIEKKIAENQNTTISLSINKANDIKQVSLYANYLVDLFAYFREEKNMVFGCPEIKIHKMMLILQIAQAYKIIDFFDFDYQIQIRPCGFKIPNLAVHTEKFINDNYKNEKISNGFEQKYLRVANNGGFNNLFIMPEEKKILYLLFQNYANYSPTKLGNFLDKLKSEEENNKIGQNISSEDFNNLVLKHQELIDDEILKPFFEDIKSNI